MTVTYHQTLPAYVQGTATEAGMPEKADSLRWFGKTPPPPIGAAVNCIVNGTFPVEVIGYFEEEGFLGLHCRHTTEVKHWGKVIPIGAETHLFGPEFKLGD